MVQCIRYKALKEQPPAYSMPADELTGFSDQTKKATSQGESGWKKSAAKLKENTLHLLVQNFCRVTSVV